MTVPVQIYGPKVWTILFGRPNRWSTTDPTTLTYSVSGSGITSVDHRIIRDDYFPRMPGCEIFSGGAFPLWSSNKNTCSGYTFYQYRRCFTWRTTINFQEEYTNGCETVILQRDSSFDRQLCCDFDVTSWSESIAQAQTSYPPLPPADITEWKPDPSDKKGFTTLPPYQAPLEPNPGVSGPGQEVVPPSSPSRSYSSNVSFRYDGQVCPGYASNAKSVDEAKARATAAYLREFPSATVRSISTSRNFVSSTCDTWFYTFTIN